MRPRQRAQMKSVRACILRKAHDTGRSRKLLGESFSSPIPLATYRQSGWPAATTWQPLAPATAGHESEPMVSGGRRSRPKEPLLLTAELTRVIVADQISHFVGRFALSDKRMGPIQLLA